MKAIIISGLPAAGKTTVARAMAAKFGLKQYSGGDILKDMAVAKGYIAAGDDWWDRDAGIRFLSERKSNLDFDRQVDERLLGIAKKGETVITSYTLPWLVGANDAVKFWLKASSENRARRMSTRDSIQYEEAFNIVTTRDQENRDLYMKLYGIKFADDLSVFDYVINTDQLKVEGVVDIATTIMKHLGS